MTYANTIVSVCCVIVGAAIVVTSCIWIAAYQLERLAEIDAKKRDRIEREELERRIDTMVRWLCWHFPISEDIGRYLLGQGGFKSISEFREELCRRYSERRVGETGPDPTKEATR